MEQTTQWAPSVILIDADYLDMIAEDFSINFGRILNRVLSKADLCHLLNCIVLDSGIQPGDNKIQVHFLHSKGKESLDYFIPSHFEQDLSGLSFIDNIGCFRLFTFPVEEIVSMEEFFLQSMTMLADAKEIENLMVVGNMDAYGEDAKKICSKTDGKKITLFSVMSPIDSGEGFSKAILAYPLMSALGIRSDECVE